MGSSGSGQASQKSLGNTGIAESMFGVSGTNPVNPLQNEGLFFWHIFFGGSFSTSTKNIVLIINGLV